MLLPIRFVDTRKRLGGSLALPTAISPQKIANSHLDDNCRLRYHDDISRQLEDHLPLTRNIGKAELEVLNYIQDRGPVTVREVAEHFSAAKGHVRTTTLNVMGRLVKKGYLARRKTGGVYEYRPRMPKRELLRGLVQDFVHRTLGGSLSPFVAYLAEDAELTEQDMAELRRLVEQLRPEKREGKP